MTDREALLKAILANPADDTPRLVYADWLTENGFEERAELIRLQYELARTFQRGVKGRGVAAHRKQLKRERELIKYARSTWTIPIEATFTRGFVSELTCSWADWVEHENAFLMAHPIERVTLTTRPNLVEHWRSRDTEVLEWITGHWPGIAFELPPYTQQWFMSEVQDPTNWDYAAAENIDFLGHHYRTPPVPGDRGASEWRR